MDADFRLLELERGASPEEIKKAYRRLAMKWHPDRNPNNPQAAELFSKITEAYDRLLKSPFAVRGTSAAHQPQSIKTQLILQTGVIANYLGTSVRDDDNNLFTFPPGILEGQIWTFRVNGNKQIDFVIKFRPIPNFKIVGSDLHTVMIVLRSDIEKGNPVPVPGHPNPSGVFVKFDKDFSGGISVFPAGLKNYDGSFRGPDGNLFVTATVVEDEPVKKAPTQTPTPTPPEERKKVESGGCGCLILILIIVVLYYYYGR